MTVKTLKYIEDYIELIAGVGPIGHARPMNQPINLARYDVKILESMALQTSDGTALTDRQSELAHKLVVKYRRQLAAQDYDITDQIDAPKFRMQPRIIDRSRTLSIVKDQIVIKFAFDKEIVPAITEAAKTSQGSFKFSRDERLWRLDMTEYNLSWAMAFAERYQFTCDEASQRLMQIVLDCEQQPYTIELNLDVDRGVYIDHIEDSLQEYIDNNLGGISVDTMLSLADNSSYLGYTVNDTILQYLIDKYDTTTTKLITNRLMHWTRGVVYANHEEFLHAMTDYARLVNRWPIYIYEPDASNTLGMMARSRFAPEEFYDNTSKKSTDQVDFSAVKCVYLNKLRRTWNQRIPLLISAHAMLHGSEKQNMLQHAEKVVYYTADTYSDGIVKF
jgi:hypothetical protein